MGCVGVQLGIGVKGNGTRKTDQYHHQSGFRMEIRVFAFLLWFFGRYASVLGCC